MKYTCMNMKVFYAADKTALVFYDIVVWLNFQFSWTKIVETFYQHVS